MPAIIRDLPYFQQATTTEVERHSFLVKRDQIVLWISISEQGVPQLDPRSPRIPAILDTGCNHNLLINQQHLSTWTGIRPEYFPRLASIRVSGALVPQFAANVWLHPNLPGKRDELASRPSCQLELSPGIAVYPAKQGAPLHPRLPLLGLRAFHAAGLKLVIDSRRRRVNIRARHRFRIFG